MKRPVRRRQTSNTQEQWISLRSGNFWSGRTGTSKSEEWEVVVRGQEILKRDLRDVGLLEMTRFMSFETEGPKETNNKSFSSKINQISSTDPKEIVRFQYAYFFLKNKCSLSILKSFTCPWYLDLPGGGPSSSLSWVRMRRAAHGQGFLSPREAEPRAQLLCVRKTAILFRD